MPTLFVSHASRDDAQASDLESWLRKNGFDDLFLDHSNIAGGDKWPQALRDSAGSCRVVVCLVTDNWLASNECFAEFQAAWYMGKRIIPLFVAETAEGLAASRLAKLRTEDQGFNIASCISPAGRLDLGRDPRVETLLKHGLLAAGALARVGLDPEAFAVDEKLRPDPFPGLASFGDEDADAALFYGRSHDIAETLQDLRKMRAAAERRPLVIVGVSGAGKSSLLKAGILPRLRREAPAWLPLRAFRPGADPLLSFAGAITRTLADFGVTEAPGTVRDRLYEAWRISKAASEPRLPRLPDNRADPVIAALERLEGQALRKAAGRSDASILIPVDQAEELIRSDATASEALAGYLRGALAAPTHWQLAFTVRSDSLSEFQKHPRFQSLKADFYDLRALPSFRFDTVVEAPARRYNVEVEPNLVIELMRDAEKEEDALPLLAFALQRLWHQYSKSTKLTTANYESVGRLDGLIEDAAERALRGIEADVPIPASEPSRQVEKLCSETFVPALAQINEQGLITRRVAKWADFDEVERELLERFDRWRLVVRRGADTGESTVEVTHEALFRKWRRFQTWILPERERLETLRAVENAARDWTKNKRRHWLVHRGSRLKSAWQLSSNSRYQPRFASNERAYLKACSRAATRRRLTLAAALAALLVLGIAAAGVVETHQATNSFLKEASSLNHLHEHKPARNVLSAATRNALAAMPAPTALFTGVANVADCRSSNDIPLADGIPEAECQLRRAGQIEPLTQEQGAKFTFSDQKIEFSRESARREITRLKALLTNAASVSLNQDFSRLFVSYRDGSARLVDLDNERVILDLLPARSEEEPRTAAFAGVEDGQFVAPDRRKLRLSRLAWRRDRLVTVDLNGDLKLWNSRNGRQLAELAPAALASRTRHIGFLKDESMILLLADDHTPQLFRSDDGRLINDLTEAGYSQYAAFWSAISNRLLQPNRSETENDDEAYDVSDDGSRFLSRHRGSTAVFNASNGLLVSLIGGYQNRSPKRFVDKEGLRVAWHGDKNLIWELSERGKLHGADLRAWICAQERRSFSPVFESGERESNPYLKGRPANVCAWQGLRSWAGWSQAYTRWKYLLFGLDVEKPPDIYAE